MSEEEAGARLDGPFRVGDWLVQPELNRITGASGVLRIEPRVMEVLVYLASCAGRVVSRSELRGAIWGETIVCDQALTRAIWELRHAVSDDPEAPRFIETIRKGGYRLVAPVTRVEAPDGSGPADRPRGEGFGPGGRRRRRIRVIAPILASALAAAGALSWLQLGSRTEQVNSPILTAKPLTSYPGRERHPAISPDGTRVAFEWQQEAGDGYDIYVKQVNADSRLRLTDTTEHALYPAWSPDGSVVAFVRVSDGYSICAVPSIGGEIRELSATGWGVQGIDWSPDGEWIAYTCWDGPGSPSGIELLSPKTLETRHLTEPPAAYAAYSWPRFSPDGRRVAFLRTGNLVQKDVWVVSTDGGEPPRRLTHSACPMAGLDWSSDGDQLVLSASGGEGYLLWLVSASDGASTALPTSVTPASFPSLSPSTNTLVYESQSVDRNIWRVTLDGEPRAAGDAVPFIASTRVDCCAEYSPDGSRIVFLSERSGHKEVWVCESDASGARRLTSMESPVLLPPRWDPDGGHIAFSAFVGDHVRAYVVDAQGGTPQCLSTGTRHEIVDGWSRDGAWIYMHCSADSGWHDEKVRLDGTEKTPLGAGGRVVFESSEGDVWFSRWGERGILAARPGECAEYVVEPERMDGWTDISFVDEGVFFVCRSQKGEALGFFDFARGEVDTLARLEGLSNAYVSMSPDRRTVLFDRPERNESDVIFVSSF